MSNKRVLDSAVKKMKQGQYTLKELGITLNDMVNIKRKGQRVKDQYDLIKRDRVYYITSRDDMAYTIISEEKAGEMQEVKILQISDLHCGCKFFDEKGLRKVLSEAMERGAEYVHIAGDLTDGHHVYRGHSKNLELHSAEEQADLLVSVLADYDFNYIASLGNHDASFSMDGSFDVGKIIETKMVALGKKFCYLPAYEGNIVHCGVVFRMIHLQGGGSKAKSYKPQIYIANTMKSSGNDCILGQKKYNVRSIQAGHFHTFYSFNMAGMDACTPGNFQFDGDLTKRMGITGLTGGIFKDFILLNGQIVSVEQEYLLGGD